MLKRDDSPSAVELRAKARALFPLVDARAARLEARTPGSRWAKLAESSAPPMSPTYRFELVPGNKPGALYIQAFNSGAEAAVFANGSKRPVSLRCLPHPVEPLVEILRALGYPDAAAHGDPADAIVLVDGSLGDWERRAKPAGDVARLILEACLWEEADGSLGDADDLRLLIPDPPRVRKAPEPRAAAGRIKRGTGL